MGHIQLSRGADLLVVAPATANILAKMAAGLADDLASTRAARDRQAGAGRARDECADVAASGDAGEHGDAARRGACTWSGPTKARWPATNTAPAGWPSRRRSWPRSRRLLDPAPKPLAGRHALVTSGPTHEPIDPGALHRQSQQRPAGPCDRRGAGRARRAGDAGQRPGRGAGPAPALPCGASRPRRRCWPRARRRCRPMSRCSPPPSRIGASPTRRGRRSRRRRGAAAPALELVANPDILATIARPGRRGPAGDRVRRRDG